MGSPLFAADVLTWHNDDARTGQNLNETILTPANVNSVQFGKLFVIPTDGQVYAQPLYVSSLTIPGNSTHDVVYIATEHDTVYACDADIGTVLWQVSLLKTGETLSDNRSCPSQITPEIGITGTPVIDRHAGPHGTIYVVGISKNGANYFQRLHALDLATGAELLGGPVDVAATYPGSGDNSFGGNVTFDPGQYKERAGLVLNNRVVYTSWASHCDVRPYTSWIIGYDQNTLAPVCVLNLTPNGTHGAIWGAGAAPAVDASGNIFALTGDGTFETNLDINGFPNRADFGNSFVKISTANNSLQVVDYWTMFNSVTESQQDLDLGSGGLVNLPDMIDVNGTTRRLAVGGGKDAHLYVVDRDNMGKFDSVSNANVYQDLTGAFAHGLWSTPAYYKGMLYVGANGDRLKAFRFTSARLETTPVSQSAVVFSYPGTTPSISANGAANGIVWAEHTNASVPAVLRAYDATNIAIELYNSEQAASGRDRFGTGNKFVVPTIANGKVYVGTKEGVGVFGLFNSPTPTPTPTPSPTPTPTPTPTPVPTPTPSPTPPIVAIPTISPNGGTFSKKVTVGISDTTSSTKIYFTKDGSTPSIRSKRYKASFNIKTQGSTVVKALAVRTGYTDSAIATVTFTVQ